MVFKLKDVLSPLWCTEPKKELPGEATLEDVVNETLLVSELRLMSMDELKDTMLYAGVPFEYKETTEKEEIIKACVESGLVSIKKINQMKVTSSLNTMSLGKLKSFMGYVGVLFDPITAIEKEELVQMCLKSDSVSMDEIEDFELLSTLRSMTIRKLKDALTISKVSFDEKKIFEKEDLVQLCFKSGSVLKEEVAIVELLSPLRSLSTARLKETMTLSGVPFDATKNIKKEELMQIFLQSGKAPIFPNVSSGDSLSDVSILAEDSTAIIDDESGEQRVTLTEAEIDQVRKIATCALFFPFLQDDQIPSGDNAPRLSDGQKEQVRELTYAMLLKRAVDDPPPPSSCTSEDLMKKE